MASYPRPESPYAFVPLDFERLDQREMVRRARRFYEDMDRRRSVREFSPDPVPRELIDLAIMTASTAPSGAHQQPWTWVVIGDAETKRVLREAVEREERENYEGGRMPAEWQRAVEPLGTTSEKPYLEVVPWIVVVFEQAYGIDADGRRRKHYYAKQSVGIACGLFIAALHTMGLATLTHTPGPMEFLRRLLDRPRNERAFRLRLEGGGAPRGYVEGTVGFAVDEPRFMLPDGHFLPTRLTAVLRKQAEEWKVVHLHFSVGVADEQAIQAP